MKPLRIGYFPLSISHQAAGDRRRLVYWAKKRGHAVINYPFDNVDLVVVSEAANFSSVYKLENKKPIVFDLIDSYLTPDSLAQDLGRGMIKRITGNISGKEILFSSHVKRMSKYADAVICSSIEQQRIVSLYNNNVHVILDMHEEIPFRSSLKHLKSDKSHERKLFWEGQPGTHAGLSEISIPLQVLSREMEIQLSIITDPEYFSYNNRFLKRDSLIHLQKLLGLSGPNLKVHRWTIENLIWHSQNSQLGVIPLDLSKKMTWMKPENRLLIMWRLGLPCLTSPSPAFSRIEKLLGINLTCATQLQWIDKIRNFLLSPSVSEQQVIVGQEYIREFHSESRLLFKWDTVVQSVL